MRFGRSLGFAALAAVLTAIPCCTIFQEESEGSEVEEKPEDSRGGSGPMVAIGGRGGAGLGASGGAAGGAEEPDPDQCEGFSGLTNCGAMTVGARLNPVNVLLVIDKSGSMTDQPRGFADDKWNSLVSALDRVLNEAAPVLNLGLMMYPYSRLLDIPLQSCGANCCLLETGDAAVNVEVGPGIDTVPQILSRLSSTPPGGGTPTALALEHAREYLTGSAASELEGDTYVLLATDGGPNCNYDLSCEAERCTANLDDQCSLPNCCDGNGEYCLDDEAVVSAIDGLRRAGIQTFVVGIPGTEDYAPLLDDFAEAGGVPNPDAPPSYWAVSADGGVDGLVDVFQSITELLVRSCEIELEREAPAPGLVNVAVDCEPIRPSEADGSGWQLDGTSVPNLVTLTGPICEEIQSNGAKRVDVVFGCKTIE